MVGQQFGDTALPPSDTMFPEVLTKRTWGNYCAIGLDQQGAVSWILRAPLGHLSVLLRQKGLLLLAASHADILLDAAGELPELDWSFAAQHLAYAHLQTRRTGLVGIEELLPGEMLVHSAEQSWHRRALWSPWHWTTRDREILDPADAASCLRAQVQSAVAELARGARAPFLELSGGLDSSILAASLAAAHAPARAVNLVTRAAEGDERDYARATAATTGLPLAEIAVPEQINLCRPALVRSARPGLPQLLIAADRLLTAKAHTDGVDAFFSGAGGDCVFASPGSAAPAADVLLRFGMGMRFLRAVDALAEIHHASAWEVARMAWQQARRGPIHARWPADPMFLAPGCAPVAAPDHPWFNEPEGILPGKRSHVRAILAALAHVDGYPRHEVAPSRYPLLSQPVIETVLRIPSWLWIEGGRDRSVARTAWADVLPAKVLERRSKGGLDGYSIAMIEANRDALRPFLLEGHTARSSLIDRPALEAVLAGRARRGDTAIYRLFPLIDVESWARAWLGEP
ncbi:MAG: hypothetical protein RIS94_243 [Pseudomonadota bacterium]